MAFKDKRRASPAYWETRLKRMNLDADRGRPSWLSFGHDVKDLDTDGRKTFVPTDGEREAVNGEWPLSLM